MMRDKLIEILRKPIFPHELADPVEAVADYLIDNGVIVLPCEVGDTVWVRSGMPATVVKKATVEEIYYADAFAFRVRTDNCSFTAQEDEVWFTREEAEAALKEGQG